MKPKEGEYWWVRLPGTYLDAKGEYTVGEYQDDGSWRITGSDVWQAPDWCIPVSKIEPPDPPKRRKA